MRLSNRAIFEKYLYSLKLEELRKYLKKYDEKKQGKYCKAY